MRVSSAQTADMLMTCLQSGYSDYAEVAEQMATGSRINSPSDDPIGYIKLQNLTTQQSTLSQYQDNIETAETMLDNSETEFSSMSDVLDQIRALAVSAGNGTYSSDDLADIATEMSTLMTSLVSFCNATDSNGNYMFSGSQTDLESIVYDETTGTYTYQGDDYQRDIIVADGITVAASDTLGDIFFSSSSSTSSNFFNDMSDLIEDLSNGSDVSDTVASMLDTIDGTASNLSSAISSIGARSNQLDALDSAHSETLLYSETLSSEIGDMDYSEASVKAQEILTNIEATQSMISKVLSLSLFDDI